MTFYRSLRGDGSITPELNTLLFMYDAWKLHIKEDSLLYMTTAVVRRQGATKISDVIPQVDDLEFVFRRAVSFNIQSYWSQCLQNTVQLSAMKKWAIEMMGRFCFGKN